MRFKATFKRTFVEWGQIEFEAEDKDNAQDAAAEMLSASEDHPIEWGGESLEDESVESTEEIE